MSAEAAESEEGAPRRRSRGRVIAGVLAEIAIVTLVAWVLWSRREELGRLWALSASDVAWLFALMGVESFIRAFEFRYCLRHLEAPIGFGDSYALVHGATLLNYGPLNAGTILRAVSLKRARGLPFTRYVAMMGMLLLMTVAGGAALGLASLALGGGLNPSLRNVLFAAFALALIGVAVLVYLPPERLGGSSFVAKKLSGLFEAVSLLRKHPGQVLLLFATATTKLLLIAGRLFVCFGALSSAVGPLAAVVFSAITSLMVLVSITPGGVGLREVFVGAFAGLAGMGFAEATLAASIDRIGMLAFAILTGIPSLLYLKRRGLSR